VRLGVTAPPWRALAGAALIGATFWYANVRIAEPIVRALDGGEVARLEYALASPPLAVRLLVVAALPALCEELLTRGVLARAIRPAVGRVLAVAISAFVFAAFHLSLVRFVPTFLLGALLASITLAADSVWPAVLAHFLNNAIAIAIAGGDLAPIASIVSAHPDLSLGASLAVSTVGLVIALAPRRPV
jgi:membrane protease YdiL (CAAX protease family)